MGNACSETEMAEAAEDDVAQSRATGRISFAHVRSIKNIPCVKPARDYHVLYTIRDVVGKDELVNLVVRNETEVHYVSRAVEKSLMPLNERGTLAAHLALLATLSHQHICRFLEAFDGNERFMMIYEKASPATIFETEKALSKGRPLEEGCAQLYCRQLVSALSVAHKIGLVHGRLAESSLLVSGSGPSAEDNCHTLRICDFGQTFIVRHPRATDSAFVASVAPEILWEDLISPKSWNGYKDHAKAFMATDMWSLGILLFRMLTGKHPFPVADDKSLPESIKSDIVHFGREWDRMPEAKEVVQGLLKHSWRFRWTAEKLLKHDWIVLSKARITRGKMIRVMQNVLLNTSQTSFKKFVLRVIAEEVPPEKLEIAQAAFMAIDKNGDGLLELQEVHKALEKYCEEEDECVQEIFEAIDRDASGTLNLAEFTAVSLGLRDYSDRVILFHTFNRFDRDGFGEFDDFDVSRVLKEVDCSADAAVLEQEVDEIVKDLDMPVDLHSFIQLMLTPPGQQVSSMSSGVNRILHFCGIDVHNIANAKRKLYDDYLQAKASPLSKPVCRGRDLAESKSPRSARQSQRVAFH